MQVGDVVVSKNGPYSTAEGCLISGCEHYTHAIVASVEPFVLVSEEGDMMWVRAEPKNYVVVRHAPDHIIKIVLDRYNRSK